MCEKRTYKKGSCKKCGFDPIYPLAKLENNEILYRCECGYLKQARGSDLKMSYKCKQCGKTMNIIDYLINPICLKCCKENHKKAIGKKI